MAFCRKCGTQLEAGAAYCTKCGAAADDDAALRIVIPIGRSGWAIAAGYAGLLAFLPFLGAVFGLLGVIFGILAIRSIKRHPEKHGLGRAWFGIVTGALLTPLWVVFFWVAAMR